MLKRSILAGAVASVGGLFLAGQAMGSSISFVENNVPSGSTVSIGTSNDPTAVVTYLASQPGTLDGYTYTRYVPLVNDGTGSLELFGLPSGSTYAPTVGDGISVTGKYSPFNQIPEIASPTAVTRTSTGNAVPGPTVTDIPTLNNLLNGNDYTVSEYLLQLNGVTFDNTGTMTQATGNFPTHANGTYTLTDGSGNQITAFQWASSYSAAGALGGTPIPQGPVNVTGIVDVFTSGGVSTPEFIPFSVTPEPASISLVGIAAFGLMARRRAATQR